MDIDNIIGFIIVLVFTTITISFNKGEYYVRNNKC
jgi:hypothetical protein